MYERGRPFYNGVLQRVAVAFARIRRDETHRDLLATASNLESKEARDSIVYVHVVQHGPSRETKVFLYVLCNDDERRNDRKRSELSRITIYPRLITILARCP